MTDPTPEQVDAARPAAQRALRTYFHLSGDISDTDIVTDVAHAIAAERERFAEIVRSEVVSEYCDDVSASRIIELMKEAL